MGGYSSLLFIIFFMYILGPLLLRSPLFLFIIIGIVISLFRSKARRRTYNQQQSYYSSNNQQSSTNGIHAIDVEFTERDITDQ